MPGLLPIGLCSTACLASLIMKLWDGAWLDLLDREGVNLVYYFRYVDDSRSFARPLIHGVRWNGEHFEFKLEWQQIDLASDKTNQQRTTEEFIKAMSSLVGYLEFEGEESGMFQNHRLPTPNKELWFALNLFSFFENEMCPNRVLQKQTALLEMTVKASLTQEVVRRLKNCHPKIPNREKHEILSCFSQKMLNIHLKAHSFSCTWRS